jgi:hypothetical protein
MEHDTLLDDIFAQPAGDAALGDEAAIDGAQRSITGAVTGCKVVAATPAQRQALAGHGAPGQRQDSQAYLRLLERRPALGARRRITPGRFARVIAKDRAYDSLAAVVAEGQAAAAAALTLIGASVSTRVTAALGWANAHLDGDGARQDRVLTAFQGLRVTLGEKAQQEHARALRKERGREGLKAALRETLRKKGLLPAIADLERAAGGPEDAAALRPPRRGE